MIHWVIAEEERQGAVCLLRAHEGALGARTLI
jgi:hypothetical protein